jgi:amino acid permease
MVMVEKSLLVVLGVAVVGFVAYEIIKREKPALLAKAKKTVSGATSGVAGVFNSAKASFMEGYASA